MGQYHMIVNLDKHEFLMPHKLGSGLKLWEQLANTSPGVGAALIALLAVSNGRGGGDLDDSYNYDGATGVIGRWGGDRIAIVGDYAENYDLDHAVFGPGDPEPESIYARTDREGDGTPAYPEGVTPGLPLYTDITDMVLPLLLQELNLKIETADGWRKIVPTS